MGWLAGFDAPSQCTPPSALLFALRAATCCRIVLSQSPDAVAAKKNYGIALACVSLFEVAAMVVAVVAIMYAAGVRDPSTRITNQSIAHVRDRF